MEFLIGMLVGAVGAPLGYYGFRWVLRKVKGELGEK